MLPRGKAACATRHVSVGTGGISSGRNDMADSFRLPNRTTVIERFDHSREFRSEGIRSRAFATSVFVGFRPIRSAKLPTSAYKIMTRFVGGRHSNSLSIGRPHSSQAL